MAAGNRREDTKKPLTNFFGLEDCPKMIPPESLRDKMSKMSTWGDDESSRTETKITNELDYVEKYRHEEQRKINNVRGRHTGRGRDRGLGRGRPQPSVFGTVSDKRVSDADVFMKYDFGKRMVDTGSLVINPERGKILASLSNNQVMIVEGFTGCGKTTQVPQFILDDAAERSTSCRIVVTQPRRIAAISVANRVGQERNWKVGGLVGYQVGMDRCVTEDTRLTYVTTGVLLQLLIGRKSLSEWTHIIIDEVHERDLDTDLLLLVIKKIMVDTGNTKTKIILMSATLNADKFARYFPCWGNLKKNDGCVNIKVNLPNQFPVVEHYLDSFIGMPGHEKIVTETMDEPKVYPECFEIATKVIEGLDMSERSDSDNPRGSNASEPYRGAVLVFLPGLLEIETFYKILTDVSFVNRGSGEKHNSLKWLVLPLHSSITNEEQQRVFVPAKKGFRKIILATNIAESSITVPDIKYVIDFCLTKSLSCDPTTNYTCLRLEWASKNQCIQRRGRCGRVSSGVVYRMITKKFYNMLEQETTPEMLKSSLESVVLQVKLLDMGPPVAVLALAVDPPNKSLISRAIANLKEIGALTIKAEDRYDVFDGDLTFVGRVLSKLPIDIRLGRLILLGHVFDCLEEAVVIAAGLSVKTPFAYPYSKRLDAYLSKLSWSKQSFSDCIALLNLYTGWYRRHQARDFSGFSDEKAWARTYFVQLTSLREMKVLIEELYKRLLTCGIQLIPSPYDNEEQLLLLKIVIAGAFYPNYFNRTCPNFKDYQKEIAREMNGKDPLSTVVFNGFPVEQPGDLYKKVIGKAVAYGNCVPFITFHNSRVIVSFDSRGNKLGPISSAVYRCIKLRHLRQVVSFPVPNRDDARCMVNAGKMKLDVADIMLCPSQVQMPALKTRQLQAIVTHIENPSEFYILRKSDEPVATLIRDGLIDTRLSLEPVRRDCCEPGQFCVGYIRGKFYRVRIETGIDNHDQVMVFLIDRGTSMWIHRQYLSTLSQDACDNDWITKPALAIKCRLQGIRASMRNGCVWCPESLAFFEEYCAKNDNQVIITIYSVVECVIAVELKNTDDPKAPNINNILVDKKYADGCFESLKSKNNQDYRYRVQNFPNGMYDFPWQTYENMQNDCENLPERLLDPPNFVKDPEHYVTLRGPHTPLEMQFNSLCRSAHLKQVMNDGNSVNSVILDHEPTSASSRLLISASVAIAARSGNMLARETTLMPPIPGLCGLLAMLFSPQLEFRVNEDYTMYTGCLSGLGVDPINSDSVYPDHDMEVVFDTVIDNEDVSLANSIRSAMNTVLSDNVGNKDIRNLRNRMRKEAISLLERKRKSMEEIWPDYIHQWNLLQPSRINVCNPGRDTGIGNVFPLHSHVTLDQLDGDASERGSNSNMYFTTSDDKNAQG